MSQDKILREQLAKIIDWSEAHADFHAAVEDFPAKLRGRVPDGFPHSAWQLLEHIRLALWDILEFSRNARHKSPKWPEGYWPKNAERRRALTRGRRAWRPSSSMLTRCASW